MSASKPSSWVERLIRKDPRGFERASAVLAVTEAIVIAMEDAGVNRSELARRLKKPRSVVTRVLGETTNPTLRTLVDYAYALGFRVRITLEPLPDYTRPTHPEEPR